ncbi:RmlC-like cupin domain-containing protein [Amylostereum chailletii]|nr:RmlC-like cupin domain-containing protein [Amylostereum chailletii]
MFSFTTISALLALSTSAVRAQSSVAELVGQLRQAPTEVDRLRLLSDDDLIFDFLNPGAVGTVTGAGGHTVEASSNNFPAVVGQGVSMTIGFLGPCGMNTPHTHPRATEINFSVNTTLQAGFLEENGAAFRTVNIAAGSAAVFPKGAIHFEMNPTCEPAMFVAGFNHEDPGVNSISQRYFGLPPDIVGASLGGVGIVEIQGLESKIPDNVVLGVDECLQRCGIQRGDQPTAQRQPRVSGNAFPNGTVSSTASGAAATTAVANSSESAVPTASTSASEPSKTPVGGSTGAVESTAVPESTAAPTSTAAPESTAVAESSAALGSGSAAEPSASRPASTEPSAAPESTASAASESSAAPSSSASAGGAALTEN